MSFRKSEIQLFLKSNKEQNYKFLNLIENDKNIPILKNRKDNPDVFLNSLTIKKIKTKFIKLLYFFHELAEKQNFYGILIDLLKSRSFLNKLKSFQNIKFPSYYNVYNIVDMIILIREVNDIEKLKKLLIEEVEAYIFETKREMIEPHPESIKKEVVETIAYDIHLYFSKKISTDEIDPHYEEYIATMKEFVEMVSFDDSIYGAIFDDIIEDNITFSINTSVICDKIAYPWYGVSIIEIKNQSPKPIYTSSFMSCPNVNVENSRICLGSLSTNILTNYSSLEYGNLTSPLTTIILNYENLEIYLKAIKQVAKEEIITLFNKIGG